MRQSLHCPRSLSPCAPCASPWVSLRAWAQALSDGATTRSRLIHPVFAFLCLIGASAAASAGSVGTADGTYDFTGTLGGTDSGGTGFKTFADKFHVSNIFEQAPTAVNPHNVLYANNSTIGGSQTVVIKAEGGSTAKRFTFKDLGLSCYAGTQTFTSLSLVLKNETGTTIASLSQSGSNTVNTSIKQLSTMTWGSTFSSSGWDNVASVELTFALSGDDPLEINFEDITIANVSASSASTPPTVSVTVTDTALRIGETSLVTFTFSEAVSGFANGDLTIPNGTLTAVSSSDGGVVWTATFTPNSNVTDPTNVIVVNMAGVASVATSTAGTGTTDSNNFAIDTQRPTATVVVADTALRIGETSLVTFTFSEAVSGFTNADLTIVNGTLSTVSSSDGGVTWTATFTPSAGITVASNVITLDNTGVTDAAGNAGSGSTDSNNYAIDTQRPTATIVVADTALSIGETSGVTITFSEAVTGFSNADLTVANGTLSTVSSSDGGITWTSTLTPSAGITVASNVITLDNTGVTDAAGNAGSGSTDSNNYAIDTQRPTATIVVADTALSIGETSGVTITFSEAVTGFSNADLTVANGTLSTVSSSDGGITWTSTLTPSAGITVASNVITLDNTGVTDAAGNAGSGSTDSNNYAIDTQRPTATIVVADTALSIGETSGVTITFSEAVTGFSNADLTVANGTLGSVSSSDGGVTWTATFTPSAGITVASNVITLDNTGVTDAAGNAGSGSTDSNNYAIDTQRPTATIVVADTALSIGETSGVTITFSEAVTGFSNADLTVANGTLSTVSSSDGGVTWTATLTPSANTSAPSNQIVLANTGVTDAAGNAGSGTTASNNYAVQTTTATTTVVVADSSLIIGETSPVTITFSEAVSGLDAGDFTVANGSLTAPSSADGGVTWSATLTPAANVEAVSNQLILANSGVSTVAGGNPGTGTTVSNTYAVDTRRPTASIVVTDATLIVGETSAVTIAFSEAVSGFTSADLAVANGSLSTVSSGDGGITWTATLTPSAGITDATNLITLDNTGVVDAAGNAGTGSTDSNNYAIDTQRPIATIVVADTVLAAGETSAVTITFSEAVTGFTNADLTVANGTLSTVSSSDGGVTWTATLTPSANTSAPSNQIVLTNSGVVDAAGNPGSGTTSSNSYAVQTTTATTTVVVADSSLIIGETSAVTITFSEAVNGLDAGDFTVGNGSLSAPTSADGGVTWSATLTPAANVEAVSNQLILANSGVSTVAGGNPGTGTTASNTYAVDTLRPTASLLVADATLTTGETSAVTITFSEAVSGFDNTDLTVPNGTLSEVGSADGGVTWTATLTPTAGSTAPGNVITLANAGVSDLAGNPGAGTSTSNAYAVRTGSFTVGGQLAGLSGSGLVLRNNGADDLVVTANGSFVFATPVADAADYLVSVATQPTAPDQVCTVTRGSGSIASANVTDVQIDCVLSSNLPSAPRNISGTAGDRQITVQWEAPQFDGGSPITGYLAQAVPQGVGAKGAANCSTTGALSCVVSGLSNGTAYTLQVSASNANGAGVAGSGTAAVTPLGVPDAPGNVQVQVSGSQATISWVPPVNTGGAPITSYTVTASPGGQSCTVTGTPPPNSCQIAGLQPGVSYTFTVVARNAAGAGAGGASGAPTGSAVPAVIPLDAPWALGMLGFCLLLLTRRRFDAASVSMRRR